MFSISILVLVCLAVGTPADDVTKFGEIADTDCSLSPYRSLESPSDTVCAIHCSLGQFLEMGFNESRVILTCEFSCETNNDYM